MKILCLFLLALLLACGFHEPQGNRYHRHHTYEPIDTVPVKDGLLIKHKCTVLECSRIDSFILYKSGYRYKK